MTQLTRQFLKATDAKTSDEILSAIAKNYGITKDEALAEVSDDKAEHLLDYLTGGVRAATSILMRRQGFDVS